MTQTIDRQFMLFNTEILRIDCLFKGHIMQFASKPCRRSRCLAGQDETVVSTTLIHQGLAPAGLAMLAQRVQQSFNI